MSKIYKPIRLNKEGKQKKDIPYYYEGMIDRKRYHFSLRTANKDQAMQYKLWIDEALRLNTFNNLDELLRKQYGIEDEEDKVTVADMCDQFKEYVRSLPKTFKPKTQESYKRATDLLKSIIGDMYLKDIKIATIQDQVDPFLQATHIRKSANGKTREFTYSKSARRHYKMSFRRIFNFAIERELMEKNPVKKVESYVKGYRQPQEGDIQKIIDHFKNNSPERWHYDWVIIALNSGMRKAELCNMTWDNVHLSPTGREHFRFTGKGDQERYVPINRVIMQILEQRREESINRIYMGKVPKYINEESKKSDMEKKLKNRRIFDDTPDTYQAIASAWRRFQKVTGVNLRIHDMRHHYVELSRKLGINPLAIQHNVGHSSQEMTLKYGAIPEEILHSGKDQISYV